MPTRLTPVLLVLTLALSVAAGHAHAAEGDRGGDRFARGTWTFQTYGSSTLNGDDGNVYRAHAGFGYFLFDHHSINLEAAGGWTEIDDNRGASGGEGWAGGLELLARWHFLRGERWSVYAEGGAGIIESQESFPADGTHFNFTPQAGLGGTLSLAERTSLMGDAKWFHISNAGVQGRERNPGFDGLLVYLGVMVGF